MNFSQMLNHELEARKASTARARHDAGRWEEDFRTRLPVRLSNGRREVAIDIGDFGPFGCVVQEVRCRSLAPEEKPESLRRRADRLVRTVTYLLERLLLLECDEPGQVALVRSSAPYRTADALAYYEARFDSDGLRFARFRRQRRGRARTRIPFVLTREVLERLADDLAGALHAKD
ncbi:MAG: hypothetical protein HYU36_17520 [Planctomycetes bacterium]|nr:hypothetical protein [Planctomycetota bacterium]